jgi:hypothetical protein
LAALVFDFRVDLRVLGVEPFSAREITFDIFFVNFRRVFENLPGTLMKLKQKDSRPHV